MPDNPPLKPKYKHKNHLALKQCVNASFSGSFPKQLNSARSYQRPPCIPISQE